MMTPPASAATRNNPRGLNTARWISVLVHVLSILVYLRPISHSPPLITSPQPILDEMHIFSTEHADVLGSSPLNQLFTNDYWGRSMNSPSSHKSYRPLSILSFRWVHAWRSSRSSSRQNTWISLLCLHRLLNILLHAAMGEMLARIAYNLFVPQMYSHLDNSSESLVFYSLVKAFFVFHPTHIEAVVNAANRAHLLALCFIFLQLDSNIPIWILALFHMGGLLLCETAIFALPAIVCTLLYMEWNRQSLLHKDNEEVNVVQPHEIDTSEETDSSSPPLQDHGNGAPCHKTSTMDLYTRLHRLLLQPIYSLLPKILILILISSSYLLLRYSKDWIHIPDGLFRKAENPFSSFQGWKRVVNYSHLFILHVSKSLGMGFTDWIGFSHEYGYDCIPAITSWEDTRIILLLLFLLILSLLGLQLWTWGIQESTLVVVLALSWMATLFPISGIVKVGTCIADRIVIPSTVVGSVFWAKMTSRWIFHSVSNKIQTTGKSLLILLLFIYLYIKVDARSREWMDHTLLLESSLRSCPRSAKSNLEMSKIYSGLFMDKYDLDKAMGYLETAEAIDPDYCDVHFQVAQILFRKQEYLEFEKRLLKGILCPFSMQGSLDLWNRYWTAALQDNNTPNVLEAKKRYIHFQAILEDAVQKEKQKEEEEEERRRREVSSRGKSLSKQNAEF